MRQDTLSSAFETKQEIKFQNDVEKFLDYISDAIIGINQKGEIVLANLHAEKLSGYTRKELLSSNLEMLVPDRFKAIHVSYRFSYFLSPHVREMGHGPELFGKRKDGTEFPADISLKPIVTGEEIIVISTIRDLTEYKTGETRKMAE